MEEVKSNDIKETIYKELTPVVLSDLEEVEDGRLCPRYQFNDEEPCFEYEEALAILLMERVVFVNNHHWVKDWPQEAKEMTSLFVNSSDIFAWGVADGDELPFNEVENLFNFWYKDKKWGPTIWCIQQRGYMPQKPIYEAIQKDGTWGLDTMDLDPSIDDRIKLDADADADAKNDKKKLLGLLQKIKNFFSQA